MKTSIELNIPTDPAERVRQQDDYNSLSDLLDSLLALEMSARTTASHETNQHESARAKELAEIYASAAAAVAELKERRTIAVAHESGATSVLRSILEAYDYAPNRDFHDVCVAQIPKIREVLKS